MSTCSLKADCKACNKSSLSLLLLRPSPIATYNDMMAPGSASAVADAALVTPFIPAGLTESRPVLRLLRAGYVHLYIPKTNKWRIFRVTDQADMLEQTNPLFATPLVDASCCRPGHNTSGFRLLSIPQAHELMGQSIWLAFSANLWSEKLKKQNKANPKAMVEVKLGSASAPAFKPDAQSLKRQLLECNVNTWRLPQIDPGLVPLFPFTSMAGETDIQAMVQTLEQAAARHPKTKGHELAVVLPDPVGYAAELNALRLIEDKRTMQLNADDAHKLQSHFTLKGLAENVADIRATNSYAPIIPKREFDRITRGRPANKGKWVSLDGAIVVESDGNLTTSQTVPGDAMGRYWMQGREEVIVQKLPEFQAKAKKEIEDGYDPAASTAWLKTLEEKASKSLGRYEKQWLQGRDHVGVGNYFALHFDAKDANRVGSAQKHSPGATYVKEASLIDGPPPRTSVALLDTYMAAYYKKPDDDQAFALRAMVANQEHMFSDLTTQLSADANGEGMRDKTVDFIKGLLDVSGEHFRVKYSWLTNATMGFAMGPMHYFSAAFGTYGALQGADALAKRPKVAALAMNAAAWFGGMDTALKSAMGQLVVRPVLVRFWIDVPMMNQAILGPGNQINGWMGARPGGKKLVTLLTDTQRLAAHGGQLSTLVAAHGGTNVAYGNYGGANLAAQATGAIVLNAATGLTPQQGATLFAQQVEEARKIGTTIRAAVPAGAKAVVMGIDGRLALASVIVQTIGVINGLDAIAKAEEALSKATSESGRAESEKKLRDAKLGYMDSMGGLVAGSLDSMRVAGEAMNLQRNSVAAATAGAVPGAGAFAQTSIHALKFGAQVAGVFGGAINGYVSYLKAGEAREKGLHSIAMLHWASVGAFSGTGVTSLVGAGLVGAEYIVARQVGTVAVQQAAGRFVAARVAGIAVASMVPVAGWVLLGIGIVGSVGAAMLEPTRLEAWARQTPFGKGPGGQKFKTLDEQNKALNDALGLATQPAPAEAKAA